MKFQIRKLLLFCNFRYGNEPHAVPSSGMQLAYRRCSSIEAWISICVSSKSIPFYQNSNHWKHLSWEMSNRNGHTFTHTNTKLIFVFLLWYDGTQCKSLVFVYLFVLANVYLFLIRFCCSLFLHYLCCCWCWYIVAVCYFTLHFVGFSACVSVCFSYFFLIVFDFACACYISLAYLSWSTTEAAVAAAKMLLPVVRKYAFCMWLSVQGTLVLLVCCIWNVFFFVVFHIFVLSSCV